MSIESLAEVLTILKVNEYRIECKLEHSKHSKSLTKYMLINLILFDMKICNFLIKSMSTVT